ncbi:MerR family transcriptional regulator [Neobacillus vireti]|uniref:MerR family transcriptional regulator n=1 Tax=Neobacillus vireti LMG 21834 TaxID=1131730 RepID=A0AB94IMB0_9BACI|nr:MerR family transcriptional regulator [Neobacillus vireti]ETI68169.1 MerR family transcriptional regulator [Neobacillus vireti LMG 21834]
MKTYTLKEVSRKINIAPGTLRQWEKDFDETLEIPRSKQGARIYSDLLIDQLVELKQMTTKKLSKDQIRKLMKNGQKAEGENSIKPAEVSLEIIAEKVSPIAVDETAPNNADLFFEAMEMYKKNFLNEVKDEIRNVIRKEVVDELKKEISKGTLITVKSLSDSIYKSTANTQADIGELTETFEKSLELTADSLQYLSNSIANISIETSEEIHTLSRKLSEASEELSHYADTTNNEISSLTEAISTDREFFVEERNQYRLEITQRERAFQQMLGSFRDVAAAKERKWWKFWSLRGNSHEYK